MQDSSTYFIKRKNPWSFSPVMIFILLCVNDTFAQELSWYEHNEKFGSYSNVTAQFNIGTSPPGTKTINQTVISIYSDNACATQLAISTLNQSKNFTFNSGQSYSVNATSFYQACVTYLSSSGACGNNSIHSVRIQPRISGTNIFTAPQPCFTVNASDGEKIVLTGSAATVAFR